MKKYWLRGMLLGVSMALLLAGGVALAQETVSVEPPCGVCCDLDSIVDCVELTPNYWTLTTMGWDPGQGLIVYLSPPGSLHSIAEYPTTDGAGAFETYLILQCERRTNQVSALANHWGYAEDWSGTESYGEWHVTVDGGGTRVAVTSFYFARDLSECEEEFVPEPGTIALLGSGLVGLAGYATLRLRSGQALRWRTRE